MQTAEKEQLNAVIVGKYHDVDIFLVQKGGVWYIAFGKPTNQQYWVEAINRIHAKNPNYEFTTEEGLHIEAEKLRPVMRLVRGIITGLDEVK